MELVNSEVTLAEAELPGVLSADAPASVAAGAGPLTVAPALVLAGDEDPIVKVKAGQDTAKHIADARFTVLQGAGHDLPKALWPQIAAATRANADRVQLA